MIDSLHYEAARGDSRALLVMLPGVGSDADEFAAHGFVASVRDRHLPIDVIAAKPGIDLYLDGKVVESLHEDIIAPALTRGHRQLWLLGISLGGLGALLYAAAQRAAVDRLILLAPFIGTPGTIAELSRAGGFSAWSATKSRATAAERQALQWLQDFVARPPVRPALCLGYGRDDRFAGGHKLLAELLPREHVAVVDGGHDWDTWAALWQELLKRPLFSPEAREE